MAALLALPAAAFFVASSSGSCPKQFSNGDSVYGVFQPQLSLPQLHLENGHSAHALIKLTHQETGIAHMYFVGSGEQTIVRFITPGSYTLNFAVDGVLASDCLTVTSARSVLEFIGPFELTRTETPAPSEAGFEMNIAIQDGWATLYEGEGGDISARSVSLNEFNSDLAAY